MTAIREAVFDVIEAALRAGTTAAEVERMPSADPMRFPALHILDDGQAPQDREAFAARYDMNVSVEGFVEGDGGAAAHGQLNALYAQVVTALVPLVGAEPLIENVEEGNLRIAVAPLGSVRRLAFSLDFTVTFSTRRGSPETV